MNYCPAILWSGECERFKRRRKISTSCLTCCQPTKHISHFQGHLALTIAELGLLKISELSCKFHCTTRKTRCGVDLPHLPLSGFFSARKCVTLGLKLLAWQVINISGKHNFMQDGAPSHIAGQVKDLLRRSFRDDHVVIRYVRYAWPPRSVDLNPCIYWLWSYLKSPVWSQPTWIGTINRTSEANFISYL